MFDVTSLILNQLRDKIEKQLKEEETVEIIRDAFKEVVKEFERGVSDDELTIYLAGLGSVLISIMDNINISDIPWHEIPQDEVDEFGRIDGDMILASEYKGQLWHIAISLDITKPLNMVNIIDFGIDGFSNICNLKIDVPEGTFGISVPSLDFYGNLSIEDEEEDTFNDDYDDEEGFGFLN